MDDLSTFVGFLVVLVLALAALTPFIVRSYRASTPEQRAAARARRDRVLADRQWDDMNRSYDSPDSSSDD